METSRRTTRPSAARIAYDHALKHFHECGTQARPVSRESLAGAMHVPRDKAAQVIGSLLSDGLAEPWQDGYRLTDPGRSYALRLIRAHRLWETFLARQTGMSPGEWHVRASEVEHHLTPEEADRLADALGNPRYDPHGDPIPTREGFLCETPRGPLLGWPVGQPALVAHLEDEPEALFAKVSQLGLAPGLRITPVEFNPDGVVLEAEGKKIHLTLPQAGLITVQPEASSESGPPRRRLSQLAPGETAVIAGLAPTCRGIERHRLLDLGVVPGSAVVMELASPWGSPAAYRLRGSLLALRREQAEQIFIEVAP